ncbi:MAG: hypothetical protein IPK46_21240 [Saprospiraceae bacterium]|nr:hypothetical protein [Saprospiraceae bacterium]
MRKILFLFAFVLATGLTANAQCSKSASADKACCASKKTAGADAKACAGSKVASASMESEAEVAAAANENIQKEFVKPQVKFLTTKNQFASILVQLAGTKLSTTQQRKNSHV